MMKDNKRIKKMSALFSMFLVLFGPLGIDLYLPSIVNMSTFFNHDMALSLSVYLFALGLFQIFWGWLSDRIGRRPVALLGLLVYSLSSAFLFHCQNFESFILWRGFQGIGAAAIALTAFVTIRDCFEGQESARYFALLNASLNMVPSLAPILGSLILSFYSWRENFAVLCILGCFGFILVWFKMPESLQQKSQSKLPPLLPLLQCKRYIAYGFTCSIALSLILSHVTLSPFILMGASGVTPTQFSLLFASNAAVIIVANLLNHRLMGNVSSHTMLTIGLALMLVSGVIMSLCSTATGVVSYMLPIYIMSIGFALMMGPANALALSDVTKDLGSATAILGAVQMAISAMISGALSFIQTDIKFYYGLSITLLTLCSFVLIKRLGEQNFSFKQVKDSTV
jgi:DHA1 family bicyclomycin/chloramphenicol resistance-like MFS transporter